MSFSLLQCFVVVAMCILHMVVVDTSIARWKKGVGVCSGSSWAATLPLLFPRLCSSNRRAAMDDTSRPASRKCIGNSRRLRLSIKQVWLPEEMQDCLSKRKSRREVLLLFASRSAPNIETIKASPSFQIVHMRHASEMNIAKLKVALREMISIMMMVMMRRRWWWWCGCEARKDRNRNECMCRKTAEDQRMRHGRAAFLPFCLPSADPPNH